jgi:hypothetical protein
MIAHAFDEAFSPVKKPARDFRKNETQLLSPSQGVDEFLLRDLETYREQLARAFKRANPQLDAAQLNEATRRTLDRLVLIRFLEDKRIETKESVGRFANARAPWAEFVAASRRLERVYNGISFREHLIDAPTFAPAEHAFAQVCERLSRARSSYDFKLIPIHVLGSIYERFLGKTIVVERGEARVEDKPDVRQAHGVYYTPEYIVRYILEQTVGELIKGKTPEQIRRMRFADIACGSGVFLLGVFDLLLRYHAAYYNRNRRTRAEGLEAGCTETREGSLRLSLSQKRTILLNNIFGVDLDAQAVEVAQLSLYLKLLEEETNAAARKRRHAFREALLPSLRRNVVSGNSLVDFDILSGQLSEPEKSEEVHKLRRRLNPLSFAREFPEMMRDGGFDAIVGNPPYIDSEWMTQHHPKARAYCASRYRAASGNWDIFCVFVERTLQLCKEGGLASLIVPNKLGSANYAAGAREVLTSFNRLVSVRDYSSVHVFPVSVYPLVYVARKGTPDVKAGVKYERMKRLEDKTIVCAVSEELSYERYFAEAVRPWGIFDDLQKLNPAERIRRAFPPLSEVAEVFGAATVAEAYEIQPLVQEAGGETDGLRLVNSGTIDRYSLLWGQKVCRYLGSSYARPIVTRESASRLPAKRRQQAVRPKIIVAGMTKILECAVDLDGAVLAGKSTSVIFSSIDLRYLLGLLNSKLISFYYLNVFGGDRLQGGYLRIGPPQLRTIPVRTINFKDPADNARHERMLMLVERMLSAKRQSACVETEAERNLCERRCANLDAQIDALVYELYGLTPEERARVESV